MTFYLGDTIDEIGDVRANGAHGRQLLLLAEPLLNADLNIKCKNVIFLTLKCYLQVGTLYIQ